MTPANSRLYISNCSSFSCLKILFLAPYFHLFLFLIIPVRPGKFLSFTLPASLFHSSTKFLPHSMHTVCIMAPIKFDSFSLPQPECLKIIFLLSLSLSFSLSFSLSISFSAAEEIELGSESDDEEESSTLSNLSPEEIRQREKAQKDKGTAGKETEAGAEISALVNYVQPVHFHSFEHAESNRHSHS